MTSFTQEDVARVELLGCPFCGCEASREFFAGDGYSIFCDGCHASAATETSFEAARAAWNRRAAQSPPPVSEGPTLADVERQLHALIEAAKDRGGMNLHDWVAARMRDAAYRALSTERLSSPSPGCDAETIEACAKVADKWAEQDVDPAARRMAEDISEDIRNLGKEQG